MSEKFDFSKIEDQKEFENLPQEEKDKIVGEAQEEAEVENLKKEPSREEVELEKGLKVKKIEIPEIGEIEYFEKKVMFPEKIVKETGGVKGYIKKTIPWENLGKTLFGLSVDKSKGLIELVQKGYTNLTEEEQDLYEKHINPHDLDLSYNKKLWDVLEFITNKEFPKETFNHIVSGEGFDPKKILVQKIFRKLSSKRLGTFFVKFLTVDKKNNKIMSGKTLEKDEEKFYCTEPMSGLSLHNKGVIWREFGGSINKHKIFGFGKNNMAFHKYLNQIKELYQTLFANNPEMTEGKDMYYRFGARIHTGKIKREYFEKSIAKIINNEADSVEITGSYSSESHNHPRIPIVLNHPDIPELRWCHADYASIPTKKGWNIIEMIT